MEPDLLAEAVSQELAAMLQVGNYDAETLLEPVPLASPRRSAVFGQPAGDCLSPAQQGRSHQCLRVPRHRHPAKPAEPAAPGEMREVMEEMSRMIAPIV